jgi:hypothetical protein
LKLHTQNNSSLTLVLRRATAVLLFGCIAAVGIAIVGQTSPSGSWQGHDGFRIDKLDVNGGAELLTIIYTRPVTEGQQGPPSSTPLVSVLRDTLGDDVPENDRIRYVWMLTYPEPSATQKLSAMVPFLYRRTTDKRDVGSEPPPTIIDVQSPSKIVWNKVFWLMFKRMVLGETSVGVRAPALHYRQNAADHRRSAVVAALAVLSIYHALEKDSILSERELKDIQARLLLTDKTFGWHMQDENLGRVFDKDLTLMRDHRGHNWELLRQYAEFQDLYFEPLLMPDGSARHAILWTSLEDLAANKGRKFEKRFLNIDDPWNDPRLHKWKGYSETRWYDDENRQVPPGPPGARSRTLIPLAVYGLDHPKIPVILIDFRDTGNAKKRELSKRMLDDLTGAVFNISKFGGLPYFFGRFVFDIVSRRRGADINFESRLRSYSQLKLLLSLKDSLDPGFRHELTERIEGATINPLNNHSRIEAEVAHKQYANLVAYAQRADGLPRKLDEDRREEMVRVKHGRAARAALALAKVTTLGFYTHREDATPELIAKMDTRRQLDFHERFIREVAFASAQPEVDADMTNLRRSLAFVSNHGQDAGEKTTRALAKIFAAATDEEIRSLCVSSLYRINNSSAKRELLEIYEQQQVANSIKDACAKYLIRALVEGQRISARDAAAISAIAAAH